MYYYAEGNKQLGPVDPAALRGRIMPETLVWREGMPDWVPAIEVDELRGFFSTDDSGEAPPVTQTLAPFTAPVATGPAMMQYSTPARSTTPPGLAITSMVMGIVCVPLLCAWPLSLTCAVLAIVFGFIARSQCARENRTGGGMALAGIILGFVPVTVVLIFAICMIAVIVAAAASH